MALIPKTLSGRFPVTDVEPSVEGGRRPAKAVVGECVPFTVTAFREGHDRLGVEVVLRRPDGSPASRARMRPTRHGVDRWEASLRVDDLGLWTFTIETWDDPWATWRHRAGIKVAQNMDVDLELEEGALLIDEVARALPTGLVANAASMHEAARIMRTRTLPVPVRLSAAMDPALDTLARAFPLRLHVSQCGPWPLLVERRRALVGSWYEFFPRSEGATLDPPRSGTFATAARRLPAVAAMGFDVVYLPPIHPIGTANRKGRNNSLIAGPHDPGSPWGIGSSAGGHDAVHPDLGTLDDFDTFVATARSLGLEIALDLALQASPDHPWVDAHPEWFTERSDGSIAYAENPPKKYQDIFPLNFDRDPEGLYAEIARIVRHWISHGVRIFRVDNPHTKPLWVWERLIADISRTDPDVVFLAEAFTAQPMMRALASVGFQQSYTYFTWRNDREGLESYLRELSGPASAYMRPNFFVNTPDILPEFLQHGGPGAFAIRATLGATLAPTWGVYAGFELFEHVAVRPGSEEYLDSEKYELRPRPWDDPTVPSLAAYIGLLNQWRREHPALQDLRSLTFHYPENPNVIAFSKRDGDDIVLVICTLDPHHPQESTIWWDLEAIGMSDDDRFAAHDLVTGHTWSWGRSCWVRLDPSSVAHIVHVRRG